MSDNGNGGSAGDGEGRGFASGLTVGAIITLVVTATMAPLVDFFAYPACYVLDRSDDFMIGSYEKAIEGLKKNRLQEDDTQREIETRNGILASRAAKMTELTERRRSCISANAAQQIGEQETPECAEVTDTEYQKEMDELQKSYDFHSVERFKEEDQLSELQKEGNFLARQMQMQIQERAKLPEICHQFFSMKTLNDLMEEPVRAAPVKLW
ncbi:hypothetical protein RGQ15_18975 [Paracoccus sp. MBLB3053]|uniref:Uncharacterized protein n=1 Tax=Paracoccus aurantius TaxID=3073814 RepID=A0ABU2HZD0_9RHOB|nr:hypothetical protein [Paracoccus sp. MBLB3053]MDS9469654.1 hypothetical protein [Paracoccus sp. MBLB3053]